MPAMVLVFSPAMRHVSNDLLVLVLTWVFLSETRQRNRHLDANGTQESSEEKKHPKLII